MLAEGGGHYCVSCRGRGTIVLAVGGGALLC